MLFVRRDIRTFILWELVELMRWQAHYLISLRQIQQFRGIHEIAAELVTAKPKQLTKDSVVITASLSGTTVETINAAKYAKKLVQQ